MAAFFGADEIWDRHDRDGREAVVLVGVRETNTEVPVSEEEFTHSLSELAELAKACGMEPVDTVTQSLAHISAGLYVGSGKGEEIKVIAEMNYSGIVIPDIRYINDTAAAAFRDNGVSFIGGSGRPTENAAVDFEDEIVSMFTGDKFVGFIFRNRNSTKPYRMEIYSGNGKLISRTDMEIVYDRISVCGDEILLSSSSELAIYTKKGICRFYGGVEEGNLSEIQKLGRKRYLVVTDMNTKVIELD